MKERCLGNNHVIPAFLQQPAKMSRRPKAQLDLERLSNGVECGQRLHLFPTQAVVEPKDFTRMQETTRSMFLSILLTQDFTKLVRAQTRLQLGSISHPVDFLFLSHIVHPELFSLLPSRFHFKRFCGLFPLSSMVP